MSAFLRPSSNFDFEWKLHVQGAWRDLGAKYRYCIHFHSSALTYCKTMSYDFMWVCVCVLFGIAVLIFSGLNYPVQLLSSLQRLQTLTKVSAFCLVFWIAFYHSSEVMTTTLMAHFRLFLIIICCGFWSAAFLHAWCACLSRETEVHHPQIHIWHVELVHRQLLLSGSR